MLRPFLEKLREQAVSVIVTGLSGVAATISLVFLVDWFEQPAPRWVVLLASSVTLFLVSATLRVDQFFKKRKPLGQDDIFLVSGECRWSSGGYVGSDQKNLQLNFAGHATNVAKGSILFLYSEATMGGETVRGWTAVQPPGQNMYSDGPIAPGGIPHAITAHFVFPDGEAKAESTLKARLCFVDQFGNRHSVKKAVFAPSIVASAVKKRADPPQEEVHSIVGVLEKQVAAAMKTEVTRYRACGRQVGGLGSVTSTVGGRTQHGLGPDWRPANSPKNHLIYEGTDAKLSSDVAERLVDFFQQMNTDEERARFKAALLKRVGRDSEYAAVGYLVLLVMFRIGSLSEVLSTAKRDLSGDHAYGFGDLVRLLDGLLNLEHRAFSVAELDRVDEFMSGVEKETFSVRERVNAIRL